MDETLNITLQIVSAVVAGIGAQVLADYLKVPSIVFLLLFGICLGTDGLNLIRPQLLGSGLEVMVSLFVALILFEGGLNLELRDLGRVSGSLRNLVTLGTLITLIGGSMAAHWLVEFPWAIAFLYASLVVVTGPTVVGPLLKQVNVDRKVATLLEGEGVLIDPVGAILAVVVLDIILNGGDADPLSVVSGLVLRLGIGAAIGGVGGWLLSRLLKASFLSEELKNLVALAGLWGLFALAQSIRSEAGLMTTVVAGVVLRASSLPEERLLRRFKEQLTILAVSVLFILLSADLSLASLVVLGWGAAIAVAVLMFIVRPINILVCTWNSDLNWRQKLFTCWVAPRGIVSASVASLFSILLTERGISGGDAVKALVFLTIISTVFIQGLTAGWVAKLLNITSKQATGAVIVGCNPLGRLIARLFQQQGEYVTLIDTDLAASREAEREGFTVFTSSALDTTVLDKAGLATAGTFLAVTNNGEVNLVVAQRAAEEFRPPNVLALFPTDEKSANAKIEHAFNPQMDLKTWNRYLMDNAFKLGETTLRATDLEAQSNHLKALQQSGNLMPLLIERDQQLAIVRTLTTLSAGDRLIYLLHDARSNMVKRLSGSTQSQLVPQVLSEVETLPTSPKASADRENQTAPASEAQISLEAETEPTLAIVQPKTTIHKSESDNPQPGTE
jgi:NhaP-type Na+/H+ or K+/H+ antiporter